MAKFKVTVGFHFNADFLTTQVITYVEKDNAKQAYTWAKSLADDLFGGLETVKYVIEEQTV